jgi:hypothetical protein
MAIEVATNDCTSLTDTDIEEMADLSAAGDTGVDVGLLSKAKEAWVLVTQARENGKLLGYSFCTLERIGGTPCVLWGMAAVKRNPKREQALKAITADQFRRALLAFPDEDVLVGTRVVSPSGFMALAGLTDIVPRPDYKATGEERAWARRLAKRFGVDGKVDDKSFVVTGDGEAVGVYDHVALKPEKLDPATDALFVEFDPKRRDQVIAFGWAMAEDLANKFGPA